MLADNLQRYFRLFKRKRHCNMCPTSTSPLRKQHLALVHHKGFSSHRECSTVGQCSEPLGQLRCRQGREAGQRRLHGKGLRPQMARRLAHKCWGGHWVGQQVVALTSPMARAFQGIIQRLRGSQSAHTKAYTTSVPR